MHQPRPKPLGAPTQQDEETVTPPLNRRPGAPDLTHSTRPLSPFTGLSLARPLEDLGSVTYPPGISGPDPELNAGAKEGKFRYVNHRSCAAVVRYSCPVDMIAVFCYSLCLSARKNQSRFLLGTQLAWNRRSARR